MPLRHAWPSDFQRNSRGQRRGVENRWCRSRGMRFRHRVNGVGSVKRVKTTMPAGFILWIAICRLLTSSSCLPAIVATVAALGRKSHRKHDFSRVALQEERLRPGCDTWQAKPRSWLARGLVRALYNVAYRRPLPWRMLAEPGGATQCSVGGTARSAMRRRGRRRTRSR